MNAVTSDIYRSSKREDLYLYVVQGAGLTKVPPELQQVFGNATLAMTLELTPERKLARADVNSVLDALREQGFYLQVPPLPGGDMVAMAQRNSKLY